MKFKIALFALTVFLLLPFSASAQIGENNVQSGQDGITSGLLSISNSSDGTLTSYHFVVPRTVTGTTDTIPIPCYGASTAYIQFASGNTAQNGAMTLTGTMGGSATATAVAKIGMGTADTYIVLATPTVTVEGKTGTTSSLAGERPGGGSWYVADYGLYPIRCEGFSYLKARVYTNAATTNIVVGVLRKK